MVAHQHQRLVILVHHVHVLTQERRHFRGVAGVAAGRRHHVPDPAVAGENVLHLRQVAQHRRAVAAVDHLGAVVVHRGGQVQRAVDPKVGPLLAQEVVHHVGAVGQHDVPVGDVLAQEPAGIAQVDVLVLRQAVPLHVAQVQLGRLQGQPAGHDQQPGRQGEGDAPAVGSPGRDGGPPDQPVQAVADVDHRGGGRQDQERDQVITVTPGDQRQPRRGHQANGQEGQEQVAQRPPPGAPHRQQHRADQQEHRQQGVQVPARLPDVKQRLENGVRPHRLQGRVGGADAVPKRLGLLQGAVAELQDDHQPDDRQADHDVRVARKESHRPRHNHRPATTIPDAIIAPPSQVRKTPRKEAVVSHKARRRGSPSCRMVSRKHQTVSRTKNCIRAVAAETAQGDAGRGEGVDGRRRQPDRGRAEQRRPTK